MEEKELRGVKLLAAKVRRDVLAMLQHRGYGHVGGSLSLVEAYAVLYASSCAMTRPTPTGRGVTASCSPRAMPGPSCIRRSPSAASFPRSGS